MTDKNSSMEHKTSAHMKKAVSIATLREELKKADGFNAKLAVMLTNLVGSMWCAYAFALLALLGLPAALKPGGMGFVPWFAQTFLQLVLLSVIMVGQSVQSVAADARAAKTYEDTEFIKDQVNEHTDGGIKSVLDRLNALESNLPKRRVTK